MSDAIVGDHRDNPHHSVTDGSPPDGQKPSKRRRVAPARYPGLIMYDKRLRDILPQAAPAVPTPLSPASPNLNESPPASAPPGSNPPPLSSALELRSSSSQVDTPVDSTHNVFGIFRRYHGPELPSHDPERETDLTMLSNIPIPPNENTTSSNTSDFFPYPNENSFLLGDWYWNHGSQKSQENFKKLLDIVGSASFSPHDVRETNWNRINQQLAVNDWDEGEWVDEDAGWQKSDISIRVPFHRFLDHPGVQDYTVKNFYHRSLTSIIREKLKNDAEKNCHFHFEPFESLWKPDLNSPANSPDDTTVRLYGELYTSPAFLDAHQKLQDMTGEPNCNLPRVVVGLMFWSDATQLTTFGHAKLWPLYMVFGNDSKYQRCKPTSNLYEHVAYFEQVHVLFLFYGSTSKLISFFQLPDEFKDFACKFVGRKKLTKELLAHCHRELIHEQWKCLLDDDFLFAYEHGIVMDCSDGQQRRFYPRIFTYSADYPEKYVVAVLSITSDHFLFRILMSSIRNKGGCPCPRCKIPIQDVDMVGESSDRQARQDSRRIDDNTRQEAVSRAREAIFQRNFAVNSAYVERQLKNESLVPSSVSHIMVKCSAENCDLIYMSI